MRSGHNPTQQNPARLSGDQQDALIKDVSQKFNQINTDYSAGHVAVHIKRAMSMVQSKPSLIRDEAVRKAFLAQKPATDARSTCTLETYYMLLKYSGANVGSFEKYYINAVNKGYVTGNGTDILDFIENPTALISQYKMKGGNGPNFELVTFHNSARYRKFLIFGSRADNRKKNFMDFVNSGAALGHFRINYHSLTGYWDGTKLRRADTWHIKHERQVMDGMVVKDDRGSRKVEFIQVLRLKGAAAAAPDPNYQPDGGLSGRISDRFDAFLKNTTAGHLLVVLLPMLLGALAHFGRKEFAKLKPHLASLEKIEKKMDQVLDKIKIDGEAAGHDVMDVVDPEGPASLLRRARESIAERDYAEALTLLEKCVAKDPSEAVAIALLLEIYLLMGESDRYSIVKNAHGPALDALEGGNLAAYLEILRDYQDGLYPEMERNIAVMTAKIPTPQVRWNFEPVLDFFKLKPNSRQKEELIGFITRLSRGAGAQGNGGPSRVAS